MSFMNNRWAQLVALVLIAILLRQDIAVLLLGIALFIPSIRENFHLDRLDSIFTRPARTSTRNYGDTSRPQNKNNFENREATPSSVITEHSIEVKGVEPTEAPIEVYLNDSGSNRVAVINAIRQSIGCGFADAKAFADNTPTLLTRVETLDVASEMKMLIEQSGGSVFVEGLPDIPKEEATSTPEKSIETAEQSAASNDRHDRGEIYRVVVARHEEPQVNMVYREIGGSVFGVFSGMHCGGGAFYQSDDGMTVSDDPGEFDTGLSQGEVAEIISELERLRAEFEAYDETGELIGFSEAGYQFIAGAPEDEAGTIEVYSEGASEDFIYDCQDEWNLDYYKG